jgi:hypothetical protein
MYQGLGQHGALMAYRDGSLGEHFTPLGLGQEVITDEAEAASEEEDKKKLLMYGGIAAGVVVIGAIIFLSRKKR